MNDEFAFEPYEAKFVAGRAESKLLLDEENYLYNLTNAKYGRWLCRLRRQENCNGTAYVKEGKITKVVPHNHPASVTEVTVMAKKQAVLASLAANPRVATNDLVTQLTETCITTEEHSFMVQNTSFARQINRKKAKILQRPGKPASLDDLETLPSSHSLTCDGERFLLFNFMNNDKRNIGFASRHGLNLLKRALLHGGDGTFSLAPDMFFQLYMLVAIIDGKAYPAVFSLLGDKTASTYRLMFEAIREAMLAPEPTDTLLLHAPKAFQCDFEVAPMKEYKAVFPEVESIRGCQVHLKRAHWRKMTEIGMLPALFNKMVEMETLVKCIYALSYVPVNLVQSYYQAILDEILVNLCNKIDNYVPKASGEKEFRGKMWTWDEEFKEDLKDRINQYLNYVERTWVGGKTRTGWNKPKYLHNIWNVHDACLAMEPIDTNANEGWNSALQRTVQHNSTIWQLIEGLRGLEAKTRAQRDEDVAKIPPGGTPIHEGSGDVDGPATNAQRKLSIIRWERRNVLQNIERMDKVVFLKKLCNFRPRKDRTETQTAEEESDSDDKEPQPGPSQGYLFELTSYIKNVAEKKK